MLGIAGSSASLRILGSGGDACEFIAARQKLFVPQREAVLVLVHHASYRLRVYARGQRTAEYAIALGQAEGPKERRGDNRTPKGMYFVAQKSRGPFRGPVARYFGGHWVKVNYPNRFDAARGLARGWLDPSRVDAVAEEWRSRQLTDEASELGGGIGFHAWAHEWDEERDGRHLSWGCVVLHVRDIAQFHKRVPVGAMVVLF
jgi:hypothetical protein